MANYYILPRDSQGLRDQFIEILDRPDETMVLVLWDDDTAVEASDFVRQITDDNQGDAFYQFVNFVVIAEPGPIIPILRDLDNDSRMNLDELEDYVIVSISPLQNIISEGITKTRFNRGKGSVNTAVLAAMARP